MDIMTAIAAATQAIDLVKSLNDLGKQYDQAEFKVKAAELLSNVADLKVTLIEANDVIRAKDAEIERLKSAFHVKNETVKYQDYRFDKGPDGKPRGRPYCPRCELVDGFLIKMAETRNYGDVICPRCKAAYSNVPLCEYD